MLVCLFFNKKFEEADTNSKLKSSLKMNGNEEEKNRRISLEQEIVS